MKFKYEAITAGGKKIRGEEDARDKFELAHLMKERGSTLLSAKGLDGGGGGLKAFSDSFEEFFTKVKMRDKIILAKNMSAMLNAGLPLSRTLNILRRQTQNKKLKMILEKVAENINRGSTLSGSLGKFSKVFSSLFVSMVKAGEESGSLTAALGTIANQMEKSYAIRKKVKGALIYPAIIVFAMIVVGILMLIFVVPTLTATFKELNVDLPATTQAIIVVSDFLSNNTIVSLLVMVLTVVFVVAFFRTKIGMRIFDFSILRIPVIGELVKKTNSARTARTMSSLLLSGVDIVESINITKEVLQNSYYKEVLVSASQKVQKGIPMSAVFSEEEYLYPILFSEMLEVGEETGKLSDMLLEVAIFYENEVEDATKNMSTIVEPFLMLIVGVVVGFFAIAMISPTYSLMSGI